MQTATPYELAAHTLVVFAESADAVENLDRLDEDLNAEPAPDWYTPPLPSKYTTGSADNMAMPEGMHLAEFSLGVIPPHE